MRKGSITIFLSLIITLVLVLFCSMIESARVQGIRLVVQQSGASALESVFAGYQQELLEQYGLLFYDGGLGSALTNYSGIEKEYESYFEENSTPAVNLFGQPGGTMYPLKSVEAQIRTTVAATDYDGQIFINSAAEYMKYAEIGNLGEIIQEQLGIVQEGEDYAEDAEKAKEESQDTDWGSYGVSEEAETGSTQSVYGFATQKRSLFLLPVFIPEAEERIMFSLNLKGEIQRTKRLDYFKREGRVPSVEEVDDGIQPIDEEEAEDEVEEEIPNAFEEDRYEEAVEESPIGGVDQIQATGFLWLVLPEEKTLSGVTISKEEFPSQTARDSRQLGTDGDGNQWLQSILFREYLLEHFPAFTAGKESPGAQYELEYILFDQDTDEKNLSTALNRLMWIREGLNIAHIYSNGEKRAAAAAMASALVGWTLIPPLVALTEAALIAAWAYGEALVDMQILLEGGRVPLVKNTEQWNLSLEGVTTFLTGGGVEKKQNSEGLTYTDYLRLLLYLVPENDLAYRAMDMIQENLQEENPQFYMANQIFSMDMQVTIEARPVFLSLPVVAAVTGRRQDNYTWTLQFSKSY